MSLFHIGTSIVSLQKNISLQHMGRCTLWISLSTATGHPAWRHSPVYLASHLSLPSPVVIQQTQKQVSGTKHTSSQYITALPFYFCAWQYKTTATRHKMIQLGVGNLFLETTFKKNSESNQNSVTDYKIQQVP